MMPLGPADRERPFGALRFSPSLGKLAFFSNGWQSWGYTGVLSPDDRFPRTRYGMLTRPMRHNPGTARPRRRGQFASDMFGIIGDRDSRRALLAGFLSQRQAFGSLEVDLDPLEPRLRMWANADGVRLDAGESFLTDWACLLPFDVDDAEGLDPYWEAVATENQARNDGDIPLGWCSWYQFFDSVTQENMLENLAWAESNQDRIPMNLIQLDDGFQAEIGDWSGFKETFPDGVSPIAKRAKGAGFQPGIWLAPLIVKPNARIIKEHPDWLLRSKAGIPTPAGFIWDSFTRALDPSHPEVLEHVQKMMRTAVQDWGYEYLKLDFLYAGALGGVRHNPKVTRAQALTHALRLMREAAGEGVTMLGCGCPIGSGIGIFDAMRIGADVAPNWMPSYKGIEFPFRNEPDFPAVRNALRNTITRAPLHRQWWVNDPDCLLIRGQDTRLSESEVQSLATVIALSAGSLIISDDLPHLDEERIEWLAGLMPPLPEAARALDWFDAAYPSRLILPLEDSSGLRHLVALLNWDDRSAGIDFPVGELPLPQAEAYHAVDFWNGKYSRILRDDIARLELPAHGVRLLALRPLQDLPMWVGDTLHISQGMAVKRWRASAGKVEATLDLGRHAKGTAWIALPERPRRIDLNGVELRCTEAAAGVYAVDLAIQGVAELRMRWE
jgi:alpha-galactosidase